MNYMCNIFQSVECQHILQKRGFDIPHSLSMCTKDQVKLLIDALLREPSVLNKTVNDTFKQITDLGDSINAAAEYGDRWNFLLAYNRAFMDMKDPEVLRIILDCGINVDKTCSNGATPMVNILRTYSRYYAFSDTCETSEILTIRQIVELFIFENIDGPRQANCYLSPMRAAKVQASLRIRAVSPEPSLLAHTNSESRGTFRQKARSLAPLNGWACAVEICHDGMLEDTNSLDGAQILM